MLIPNADGESKMDSHNHKVLELENNLQAIWYSPGSHAWDPQACHLASAHPPVFPSPALVPDARSQQHWIITHATSCLFLCTCLSLPFLRVQFLSFKAQLRGHLLCEARPSSSLHPLIDTTVLVRKSSGVRLSIFFMFLFSVHSIAEYLEYDIY